MPYRNRRSVAVLGVPFDNVTMHEAMDLIEEKIEEQGFHQVATANVDFVVNAIHDQSLQEMLCSCDLVVPDGMPIVWASRLMGSRLKERVSGVDLIPRLAELASKRRYGIYLLGASEKSSRRASEVLKKRFPKLRIVGRHCPPVSPLAEMDHEGILRRIERAQPDILLVAMGHPKQEQWLAMHRHRLKVPLCMGVGASLDFLAGEVRAAHEPRRLTQRYLVDAYGLARHLPLQMAANAIQPRTVTSTVQTYQQDNATVISIQGNFKGSLLTEFEGQLERAYREDHHIVLDLSQTAYFGLDSVGSLVHLAKVMKRRKRELWLVAMPPHGLRVLRAARLSHYFVSTSSISDALYRIRKAENQSFTDGISIHPLNPHSPNVHIQVELLKDLCRRIVYLGQSTRVASGPPHTRTSATR
jgi:N-acetylglucosaminyldiphosphoundecaprenol N-acetyl-beta-D-mannosaminyltransferase